MQVGSWKRHDTLLIDVCKYSMRYHDVLYSIEQKTLSLKVVPNDILCTV